MIDFSEINDERVGYRLVQGESRGTDSLEALTFQEFVTWASSKGSPQEVYDELERTLGIETDHTDSMTTEGRLRGAYGIATGALLAESLLRSMKLIKENYLSPEEY